MTYRVEALHGVDLVEVEHDEHPAIAGLGHKAVEDLEQRLCVRVVQS